MGNSSAFRPLRLGDYPTPVEPIPAQFSLAVAGKELWVKRDDRTHAVYGGNKVRKLEWLLAGARAGGAKRLVTLGAAGSHHVLATTYFGRREGFDVEAVLVPQPRTAHAVDVLRASLGLGLRAFPVRSWGAAPWAVARRLTTGARFVAVGGSSVLGSMGYVAAAHELAEQVRAGHAPKPDVVVVALGSGGTAAGLAAGLAYEGLATRVVGVCVSEPQWLLRCRSSFLLCACSRRARAGWGNSRRAVGTTTVPRARPHLSTDARFLGQGYGHATREGDDATDVARAVGLSLDPTYTAKAFAAALSLVREPARGPPPTREQSDEIVLYWHTLSGAPLEPLLDGAPDESELEPSLRRLLTRPSMRVP